MSRFTTTEPDVACELMSAAYVDARLRFSGSMKNMRLEHVRYDLGPVRLDKIHHTLTTDYEAGPFGCLQFVRVVDHTVTYDTSGREQHFGPASVFLAAQPDKPFTARIDRARLQSIGMDLALLAEVTDEPPLDAVRRFRADALPAAQAGLWQRTVDYVTDLVRNAPVVAGSPLVRGALQRSLAVAALAAFDPNILYDQPRDRADATPAAVRRAVAFLEANPDLDIGVADVARAARVSVRTLQIAFRRHLDITPMAYLRRVRLDRAHAELCAADPAAGASVTAIAARWGFTPTSRFSAAYRAAYGEPPSRALHR